MSERIIRTKQIVDFWKSLGIQLSVSELSAFSDNGPVRGILRDILLNKRGYLPDEVVEIGALYKPLCLEIGGFSRALLIDPIYAEKDPPKFGPSIVTSSTPLPRALSEIVKWLKEQGVLVLENVINYLDGSTVNALLR